MANQLAKAMRAHAQQRVNEGIAPRDPLAIGLRLAEPEPFPWKLIGFVILCVGVLVAGVMWALAGIPPAHILIVAFVIGLVVLRFRPRRR